jgi:DNA helicase HerA-like ATPase
MGISGMPGSGKSTYATYLLAQVSGIPIYVLDIHYPDTQSLGARIEREGIPVKIYSDIESIEQHLSEMKEGITVIDEYTSLLRQKPTLKARVLDYVQQGRKYGVYIWLIGQHWSSKSAGGTDIRDSLVAFAALRQRVRDGRMSTGISDIPDTGKLKHSEVLLVLYGSGIQDVYTYDSKLL